MNNGSSFGCFIVHLSTPVPFTMVQYGRCKIKKIVN